MRKKGSYKILFLVLGLSFLGSLSCKNEVMIESSLVINHLISIELFPEKHTFKASDRMEINNSGKFITLNINKNFNINSIILDGKRVDFRLFDLPEDEKEEKLSDDDITSYFSSSGVVEIPVRKTGKQQVIIDYEGKIFEDPTTSQFSREYLANQTTGIISLNGTFLSPESFWYPQGDEGMCRFEVITKTPVGYETVTQGTRMKREEGSEYLTVHWKNENPSDSIYLQAGPYDVKEIDVDGIKIYTYFFKGSEKLSSLYLRKSRQYITMYNKLLGRYPYDKFAVVENFFETGYGMPSWTLLGSTVLRLPFIPDTSLPHEICHNWWGNGVFVDYETGNWCEGLTVFCADYLLKKQSITDGDIEYRRQTNRDYASYVKENNDFPLTEFRSRHNPAERAVGYGKTMMVYHDLQRKIGEENFFRSLRRLMSDYLFKIANWNDVLSVFENENSIKLDDFYKQWIEREGAPLIWLTKVRSVKNESEFKVSFSFIQQGKPYELDVPVLITTINGEVKKNFKASKSTEEFEVILNSKPILLEIDPEHMLFRRLHPEEIPSSIAKVFGSESQFIVMGSNEDESKLKEYRNAAEMINKTKTGMIKTDVNITKEELASRSIIILGSVLDDTAVAEILQKAKKNAPWEEGIAARSNAASVVVYDHPDNGELGIMHINGKSKSDIISVARKLPHYGKYSYLLFHADRNVAKGIWEIEKSPLIYIF